MIFLYLFLLFIFVYSHPRSSLLHCSCTPFTSFDLDLLLFLCPELTVLALTKARIFPQRRATSGLFQCRELSECLDGKQCFVSTFFSSIKNFQHTFVKDNLWWSRISPLFLVLSSHPVPFICSSWTFFPLRLEYSVWWENMLLALKKRVTPRMWAASIGRSDWTLHVQLMALL